MIRVLIVDETPLRCDATAAALETESDFQVTEKLISTGDARRPGEADVALAGYTTSSKQLIRTIKTLVKQSPELRIIVTSVPPSDEVILRAIEAGAVGYILHSDPVEKLFESIRAAYHNEAIIEPRLAAALIARLSELADLCTKAGIKLYDTPDLTSREREVLGLLSHGKTNQEIADSLEIEVGTVKNHVHSILKKLNVRSRQEAVALITSVSR